jgi:asparagine synthase (glutamine-hydrolysing)
MSGIGGVVRLDGAPVSRGAIESLANAVAHRGRDGQGVWSDTHAALVHAMLHTTPESVTEPQPFVEGELVITADVRLDDRARLLAELAPPKSGDAALIAAAYRRWGAGCVGHLEGDFAFAIWDAREQTLFCARDPFGVKSLVYAHVPGTLFAFGSVARVVLALEEVPRAVDETRIADYLAIHFADVERTFHEALRRLPGGCTLTLRDGGIDIQRYWSPESVRPLRLKSDAEYAEGFLEHFNRAVHDRMRVVRPSELGSMLSGGLDSTFISCVARNASPDPLPVFSWIFSDAMEADEREYQQAVLATGGFRPVTLDSKELAASPWCDLDSLLPDGPPYAPNYYLNAIAGSVGRDIGVTTFLDGLGGDSTISRGAARFTELFVRARPFTLARELRALGRRRGDEKSLPRLFLANVAAPLMPPSLLQFALRLRGRAASGDPGLKLLHPRLAKLSGATRRRERLVVTTRQEHLAQFRAPLLAEGLELFDRVMAAAGAEGRYPFFDRRLAEYCIALPGEQKFANGYDRIVARRAMEGIVPPAVQWRGGKGAPGLHVIEALRADRPRLDAIFFRDPSALAPYVDVDTLRRAYMELFSGRPIDFRTAIRLWSAATLGQWLSR